VTAHTKRSEFFQVPEPRWKLGISPSPWANIEEEITELFQVPECRRKIGIFPSPRTYMEETNQRVTPYKGRALGIFQSPIANIEGKVRTVTPCTSLRWVLRQQAAFEAGGSLEFSMS